DHGAPASIPPGFSALGQNCWFRSRQKGPAPAVPALSRRSSCFPAWLYPPPRYREPTAGWRLLAIPDISLVIKPDILTCYQQITAASKMRAPGSGCPADLLQGSSTDGNLPSKHEKGPLQ